METKIITLSKIGYNHPSQANWSYGIWKLDLIDTTKTYCMSYIFKEAFGGDSRIITKVRDITGKEIILTKDVYPSQKIVGVKSMLDIEDDKVIEIINSFLHSN